MAESRRVLRVEREIKECLAQILLRELKIPLPGFVSIVEVGLSPDLRSARVYLRVAGGEAEKKEADTILTAQRTWIQNRVGKDLRMKFSPVLKFILGSSTSDQVDDIERMLANLHRRQA